MKKEYKLSVRLNQEDYDKLNVQVEHLKISKNDFFRELIRKDMVNDIKQFNDNLKELFIIRKSLTTSLNQIARKVNSEQLKTGKILEEELEQLWQLLKL
ncbi:MAG: hypothetical protein ACRCVS_03790 [Fusobacteriaceae bacterium]